MMHGFWVCCPFSVFFVTQFTVKGSYIPKDCPPEPLICGNFNCSDQQYQKILIYDINGDMIENEHTMSVTQKRE